MTSFNEDYSMKQFDKYCSNDFAQHIVKLWKRNERAGETGVESYLDISSKLLILGKHRNFKYMADVLFVGAETMAAGFLGDESHRLTPEFEAQFTDDYDRIVGQAQQRCFEEQEPVYDLISSELFGEKIVYERVLLPIKTKAHAVFLLCYAMPIVKPAQIGSLSSGEYLPHEGQQKRCYTSPCL